METIRCLDGGEDGFMLTVEIDQYLPERLRDLGDMLDRARDANGGYLSNEAMHDLLNAMPLSVCGAYNVLGE